MDHVPETVGPYTPDRSGRRETTVLPAAPQDNRSPRRSSRVKKNPSVTPNRFNKFFHPRLKDAKKNPVRTSRKALRNLSAANLNSRLRASQLTTASEEQPGPPSKKRRLSFSSVPSLPSSPIRNTAQAPDSHGSWTPSEGGLEDNDDVRMGTDEDDVDLEEEEEDDPLLARPRMARYQNVSSSNAFLSRQLGRRAIPRHGNETQLWQHETANFYSLPGDIFTSSNNSDRPRALPFSLASFNQQESVAVGNEDGQVEIYRAWPRMPNYSHSLRFECQMLPHDNAIMDMEFSPDDLHLATASGDQTCRIIDMNTRTGIHTLAGHEGSLKNVRWQPGSGNKILATCSRDGSICLWDLRCAQKALGSLKVKPLTRAPHFLNNSREVLPKSEILGAHTPWDKTRLVNGKRQAAQLSSKADFAVTACLFISESRPHLLATASEHNAMIKLWDMRASYKQRSGRPTPVSVTAEPSSHDLVRPFGVTSMVMSTDRSRLYSLCRDNTIYAYSTAHLVLGGSTEMSATSKQAFKASHGAKTGLRPLYGFRHQQLRLSSFYDKISIRPKTDEHTEILAAGTGEDCAVLFPTDERYLTKSARRPCVPSDALPQSSHGSSRPRLSQRTASQTQIPAAFVSSQPCEPSKDPKDVPIYYHGTALVNAHKKEVTCCAWIPGNGQLVTVADDYSARCWYEDDPAAARHLRLNTERDASRIKSGWASVVQGWDEDDS